MIAFSVLAASTGGLPSEILTTLVAAVGLGIAAQILAERFRLPAILPLLLIGIAAGPQLLGVVTPGSLGAVLEEAIHIGVAVILFEGSLSLNLLQLREVGSAVRNLLTVGLVITGVGSAVLAQWVTGMPWTTAALFGAILTVTGPTVIVPLLRHMIAPRRVKTILVSEGLIVDPIGVVLAYLVLQWIERAGMPLPDLVMEVLILTLYGVGVGFIFGKLGQFFARTRVSSAELRNLTVLALVLVCYFLSELLQHQSGILAVVVMGITMSAANIPDLEPLRAFKEQLTTLLISTLFVLLAAQLDLGSIAALGWRGMVVAMALILVVRPLSVFLSVMPKQLTLKERTVLALTAPRGIVAAAVASLAALELTERGIAGGPQLEGLVYLSILVTGAWATLMALVLPKMLGFADDPSRRLTVLVGANTLSRELGLRLAEAGRKTIIVDSVPAKLQAFRSEGLDAVRGDARDADTYEKAGVERDTQVLLLTPNDELNLLAAELVHHEFGVEHPVVALQDPSPEFGSTRRTWMDLLGGRAFELSRWQRRLDSGYPGARGSGTARLVDIPVGETDVVDMLRVLEEDLPERVVPIVAWQGDDPRFRFRLAEAPRFDRVTMLVAQDSEVEQRLEALLAQARERGAEEPMEMEEAAQEKAEGIGQQDTAPAG